MSDAWRLPKIVAVIHGGRWHIEMSPFSELVYKSITKTECVFMVPFFTDAWKQQHCASDARDLWNKFCNLCFENKGSSHLAICKCFRIDCEESKYSP
jgi:hypothetical protein